MYRHKWLANWWQKCIDVQGSYFNWLKLFKFIYSGVKVYSKNELYFQNNLVNNIFCIYTNLFFQCGKQFVLIEFTLKKKLLNKAINIPLPDFVDMVVHRNKQYSWCLIGLFYGMSTIVGLFYRHLEKSCWKWYWEKALTDKFEKNETQMNEQTALVFLLHTTIILLLLHLKFEFRRSRNQILHWSLVPTLNEPMWYSKAHFSHILQTSGKVWWQTSQGKTEVFYHHIILHCQSNES